MSDAVEFSYRLPLTYVRVNGTRTETTDELADTTTVECTSVVTTETGADLRSRVPVRIGPASLATQKATWNLTADGRLTGADVTITASPAAAWKAAFEAGGTVLAAGAPLLATGPVGWAALAGGAALAAGVAGVAAHGRMLVDAADLGLLDTKAVPDDPADADPERWDVHEAYVRERPADAQVLADYRAARAAAEARHAKAVLGAAGDVDAWSDRVRALERVLASVSVGAARAEAAYAVWQQGKRASVASNVDERFRVDQLPTSDELHAWLRDPSGRRPAWAVLAEQLQVAVSVDLVDIPGDDQRIPGLALEPLPEDTVLHRQPRPAVLTVWTLTADGAERTEVRRLFVAYPGNEARISIASGDGTSSALSVAFDENGALTKVSADVTDRALQRANDVSALVGALGTGAETGQKLREAFSPPSLVDRAAEAKAARELGLVPTAPDPLEAVRKELEEQQLRARVRIAEQLGTATSPPVLITVTEPLGS